MKCCDKCKCKCPPKKVDFTIMIPEGIEMGSVEVYQVDKKRERVNEFRPSRVDSDWDSDSEDPDFIPGIDSDEDPYENADLTEADKEELRLELVDILMDMAQNQLDESD